MRALLVRGKKCFQPQKIEFCGHVDQNLKFFALRCLLTPQSNVENINIVNIFNTELVKSGYFIAITRLYGSITKLSECNLVSK